MTKLTVEIVPARCVLGSRDCGIVHLLRSDGDADSDHTGHDRAYALARAMIAVPVARWVGVQPRSTLISCAGQ